MVALVYTDCVRTVERGDGRRWDDRQKTGRRTVVSRRRASRRNYSASLLASPRGIRTRSAEGQGQTKSCGVKASNRLYKAVERTLAVAIHN